MEITSELLAAYAAGNVSPAERLAVRQYLKEHPDRLQAVLVGMDDDFEIRSDRAASGIGGKKTVGEGLLASVARLGGESCVCACMMPAEASGSEEDDDVWEHPLFDRTAGSAAKKKTPADARSGKRPCASGFYAWSVGPGDADDRNDWPWQSDQSNGCLCDGWLPEVTVESVVRGKQGPGDAGGTGGTGGINDTDITKDAGGADSPRRLEQRLDELLDSMDWTQTRQRILPMTAIAAEDQQNNLCAIRCEGIALRHFGFAVDDEELIKESRAEGWLRAEGTALHHIGKLSGRRGLNVAHRYDCSTEDILRALEKKQIVIAVVDGGELVGDPEWESMEDAIIGEIPDHAVVVTALDNDTITLLDPFTSQDVDTYPLPQFLDAWADSSRNLILISDGDDYEPHPIDLSGIEIPDDLQDLCEALAENAHEIWACDRMREGWTYGPVHDEAQRRDPDLLPYNRLSDSKKHYGREQMMNLLRLLEKLGWDPVKR